MAATITPGRTWVNGETVTATKLNTFMTSASVDAIAGMSDDEIFAQVSGTTAGYTVDPIRSILGIDAVGGQPNIESGATRDQSDTEILAAINTEVLFKYVPIQMTPTGTALGATATKLADGTLTLPAGYNWEYVELGFCTQINAAGTFIFDHIKIGAATQTVVGTSMNAAVGAGASYDAITTMHKFVPSTLDGNIAVEYYAHAATGVDLTAARSGYLWGLCRKV